MHRNSLTARHGLLYARTLVSVGLSYRWIESLFSFLFHHGIFIVVDGSDITLFQCWNAFSAPFKKGNCTCTSITEIPDRLFSSTIAFDQLPIKTLVFFNRMNYIILFLHVFKVFKSSSRLFIVMEMASGGEMYERVVSKGR